MLFYGHVDGQPVDPGKWVLAPPFDPVYGTMKVDSSGTVQYAAAELPARPEESEVRLFARASSDAKAPIMLFLVAWDQLMADGKRPDCHVKFVIDPMEEASSPDLPGAVETHREALAADHLIILDGPVHLTNQPTLVGGARGSLRLESPSTAPACPSTAGTTATTPRIPRCGWPSCWAR